MGKRGGWNFPRLLFFVGFLILGTALSLPIQIAHGAGPTFGGCTNSGPCTATLNVSNGDFVVLSGSGSGAFLGTVLISGASCGSGFTKVLDQKGANSEVGFWYCPSITSGGSLSFATQDTGYSASGIYDFGPNIPWGPSVSSTTSFSSGNPSTATLNLGSGADYYFYGFGTDYQPISSASITADEGDARVSIASSSSVSSYTGGIQNGPTTGVIGGLLLANVIYVQTTVYVPPTSTQIQYWYFPILFMGLYDMAFLTVGFLNRVSTKALIYLMITGLLMGSVFSESVGLSALPLIVITLITYMIYIYRIRTASR